MFDFKKEVNKFRPMTEVADLENTVLDNEVQDVMDLLRTVMSEQKAKKKKEQDK